MKNGNGKSPNKVSEWNWTEGEEMLFQKLICVASYLFVSNA